MDDEMRSQLEIPDIRIYLTEFDKECLTCLLARMSRPGIDCEDLTELKEILTRAFIVEERNCKNQIVSMDSTVRLKDLDFNREHIYTLVWPLQGNLKEHKVSVLAPIGRGMLGHRVGDVFDVKAPWGFRTFRVEEIQQLEDEEPATKLSKES